MIYLWCLVFLFKNIVCLFICSSLLFYISYVIGKFPQVSLHVSCCNQVTFFAVVSVSWVFSFIIQVIACIFESYCYLYNKIRISLLTLIIFVMLFILILLDFLDMSSANRDSFIYVFESFLPLLDSSCLLYLVSDYCPIF